MKRPETKNYKTISGAGAYDYISDVNQYFNYLEGKLKDINVLADVRQVDGVPDCNVCLDTGFYYGGFYGAYRKNCKCKKTNNK